MGARALASLSSAALGKRLALLAYARFWHPCGMQTSLGPCPVVVSPAAPKRPPATICQPSGLYWPAERHAKTSRTPALAGGELQALMVLDLTGRRSGKRRWVVVDYLSTNRSEEHTSELQSLR